ncbi:hypothetical protein OKW27_002670 [Paraburkholderia sp. 35.1]
MTCTRGPRAIDHCTSETAIYQAADRETAVGREDSLVDSAKCHSPTPVYEWQQTNLQPTHGSLSPNVGKGRQD